MYTIDEQCKYFRHVNTKLFIEHLKTFGFQIIFEHCIKNIYNIVLFKKEYAILCNLQINMDAQQGTALIKQNGVVNCANLLFELYSKNTGKDTQDHQETVCKAIQEIKIYGCCQYTKDYHQVTVWHVWHPDLGDEYEDIQTMVNVIRAKGFRFKNKWDTKHSLGIGFGLNAYSCNDSKSLYTEEDLINELLSQVQDLEIKNFLVEYYCKTKFNKYIKC